MEGDQGKLQQILMNLITNAKDAVENRKEKKITINISNDEEKINIQVRDNGSGIPEPIQKDIFNPFFTTKEINKGTGIGLSLVANFIKELNGTIQFDSSEAGTTFFLNFPIYQKTSSEEAIEENIDKIILEKKIKRILIVEDEQEIREILEEILQDLGFETVSVKNGLEDMKSSRKTDQFDLVVSDIKMPKMTGYELISAAEKLKTSKLPKFIFLHRWSK